jgi:hypothetical protein
LRRTAIVHKMAGVSASTMTPRSAPLGHLGPDSRLQFVAGVGPARARHFERLGLNTIEQLLRHYPRTYLDARRFVTVKGSSQASSSPWSASRTPRRSARAGPLKLLGHDRGLDRLVAAQLLQPMFSRARRRAPRSSSAVRSIRWTAG